MPAFTIYGGSGTKLHKNETCYIPMFNYDINKTESAVWQPMPMAGNVSNFYVVLNGSPGSGKSYTFVVRKEGLDTPVTCTISGTDTIGSDLTHSVSFAAGDYISIMVTPSTSDPAEPLMWWMALFSPSE
jgi:hypothetical protein